MRAMILEQVRSPLVLKEIPKPIPQEGEILIEVIACGVCRTDLHIVNGELPLPKLPLIPGHQIVGKVVESKSPLHSIGSVVGVPWLGKSCGSCFYCSHDTENLCDAPLFTGYLRNGGFAEYAIATGEFAFSLSPHCNPFETAPLLCAGMVGYRSLLKTQNAIHIGFYGFGSSAHILTQIASRLDKKIYAFTRPGDAAGQEFAKSLGAIWAGDSTALPPNPLDAAIIFAPDGTLVPLALKAVRKGGIVVLGGIYMSPIPSFPYDLIWEERTLTSVANLTRKDGREFLALAQELKPQVKVTVYPLEKANEALNDLQLGKVKGSAVLSLGQK